MDEMATLVFTGRNVMATRKAIKEMARAGGHHEIRVDMRPPTDGDAQNLLMLAAGHVYRKYHDYRWRQSGISKYPLYVADLHYELRMAEWAEEVMSRNV
jgi:hypothetical protein